MADFRGYPYCGQNCIECTYDWTDKECGLLKPATVEAREMQKGSDQ
jgi:hypothetical protein